MRDARQKIAWDHTAALLQILHNANCAKREDQIRRTERFNPYRQRQKVQTASIEEVISAFVDKED